jgi:hypothetical protein
MTSQSEAEQYVGDLWQLRKQMRDDRERDKAMSDILKGYMEVTDETELIDGENGVAAKLQERQASGTLDLQELAQAHPDIVVMLARDGGLKADLKTINDLTYAGELVDYMRPGSTSYALVFKALVS